METARESAPHNRSSAPAGAFTSSEYRTNEWRQNEWRGVLGSSALALGLACLVLLPLLGHKLLAEWDEGIYAEISREMLTRGFLVPHWNGQLWLEKPPLMLWITAIFFKLFGVHEFWARAGSAFSGIATVTLLHGWLARRRDRLTAWIGSLVLLCNFGFQHASHTGEMDVLLTFGSLLAVIGLAEVQQRNGSGWYFFWSGMAVAFMTKGAACVVVVLTLLLIAGLERWWRGGRDSHGGHDGKRFLIGFAVFLAVVLPWHLAMVHLYGTAFLREYFGFEVLHRATSQIEGHLTHWWYYLGVLLVSAAPFVVLYPNAIVDALRRKELRAFRVFAVYALVVIGFFTAVQTRLPHYIAPTYPAFAAVTAIWIADRLRRLAPARRTAPFWAGLGFAAVALYAATALLTVGPRHELHSVRMPDGSIVADNKESLPLLRDFFRQPQPVPGPLLLWGTAHSIPIPSSVFYARRPVQRVQLQPLAPGTATDKYVFDPEPLSEAAGPAPRLILLDRSLESSLPARFAFTPLDVGKTVEIGTIMRK